jgi:hypothetical protein
VACPSATRSGHPPNVGGHDADPRFGRPLGDNGEDSYVGHDRLKDRIALITGADSGIGRAVAIVLGRSS